MRLRYLDINYYGDSSGPMLSGKDSSEQQTIASPSQCIKSADTTGSQPASTWERSDELLNDSHLEVIDSLEGITGNLSNVEPDTKNLNSIDLESLTDSELDAAAREEDAPSPGEATTHFEGINVELVQKRSIDDKPETHLNTDDTTLARSVTQTHVSTPLRTFTEPLVPNSPSVRLESPDGQLELVVDKAGPGQSSRPGKTQHTHQVVRVLPIQPMSMSSELAFFKQARKGKLETVIPQIRDGEPEKQFDFGTHCQYEDPARPDSSPRCENGALHCEGPYYEHKVALSSSIVQLVTCLQSEYGYLLESSEEMLKKNKLDCKIPKVLTGDPDEIEALLSLVKGTALKHVPLHLLHRLLGLFVLQQTTKTLCSYGVRVAYHYLESLLRSMNFSCISFLERWVSASRKRLQQTSNIMENSQAEDHPKLTILKEILQGKDMKLGPKILILAERRAFFTLFSCLQHLGLTAILADSEEKLVEHGKLSHANKEILNQDIRWAMTSSDCILLPYMYLSASFPIGDFSVVIQYDDVPFTLEESKREVLCLLKTAPCCVHKLIVEFPATDVQTPVYKGTNWQKVKPPSNDRSNQTDQGRKDIHTNSSGPARAEPLQGPQGVRILQNEAYVETVPQVSGFHVRPDWTPSGQRLAPAVHIPIPVPENTRTSMNKRKEATECNMVIVLNVGRRLLMQRRSWYQYLISIEREYLQIVERHCPLPVDLILSPATSLTVYIPESFHIMATHDWGSNLRCMEAKIREHMKASSISFHVHVLIFEGPSGFTSAVQHLSEELHAASTDLNITLQCFVSDSARTTDTIIKGCIEAVLRTKKLELYPIMQELPTEEEVFLTRFPSINHLSAHAILSCGISLPRFLLLTYEQQVEATEPFDVPLDSLMLFKVQYNSCDPHAGLPAERAEFTGFTSNFETSARNDPDPCVSFLDFPPACMISGDMESEHQDEQENPPRLVMESLLESKERPRTTCALTACGSIQDSESKTNAIEKWLREQKQDRISSRPSGVNASTKKRRSSMVSYANLASQGSSQLTYQSPSHVAAVAEVQPLLDPSVCNMFRHGARGVPKSSPRMVRQTTLGLQEHNGLDKQTAKQVMPMRSWTPQDKRAQEVLTFQKRGHQSQSCLVWERR